METIHEPPLAADINIQTCAWMPIDVNRIKGSVFVACASAEVFRAAVLLWCSSWHQVPASSLPNNDQLLAALAGFGRDVESWLKVKVEALYGFKLCTSDGLMYHPLIAEKAIAAYGESKKIQEQARSAGIKSGESRRQKRDALSDQYKLFDDTNDGSNGGSNGGSNENERPLNQRKGKEVEEKEVEGNPIEEKKEKGKKRAHSAVDVGIWFNRFWNRYPHRIGKLKAHKSFLDVLEIGVSIDVIMAGVELYIRTKPADRPWCNPATWLNQGRWEDQPAAGGNAKPRDNGTEKPSFDLPVHGERVTDSMCPLPGLKFHVGKVFLLYDSEEWHAWNSFYHDESKRTGKPAPSINTTFRSKAGNGWSFPGRWPPGHAKHGG